MLRACDCLTGGPKEATIVAAEKGALQPRIRAKGSPRSGATAGQAAAGGVILSGSGNAAVARTPPRTGVMRTPGRQREIERMAGPTRLELATSGLTGRRSNQLNYDPARGKGAE